MPLDRRLYNWSRVGGGRATVAPGWWLSGVATKGAGPPALPDTTCPGRAGLSWFAQGGRTLAVVLGFWTQYILGGGGGSGIILMSELVEGYSGLDNISWSKAVEFFLRLDLPLAERWVSETLKIKNNNYSVCTARCPSLKYEIGF